MTEDVCSHPANAKFLSELCRQNVFYGKTHESYKMRTATKTATKFQNRVKKGLARNAKPLVLLELAIRFELTTG